MAIERMTYGQAAVFLDCSIDTVRRMVKAGKVDVEEEVIGDSKRSRVRIVMDTDCPPEMDRPGGVVRISSDPKLTELRYLREMNEMLKENNQALRVHIESARVEREKLVEVIAKLTG